MLQNYCQRNTKNQGRKSYPPFLVQYVSSLVLYHFCVCSATSSFYRNEFHRLFLGIGRRTCIVPNLSPGEIKRFPLKITQHLRNCWMFTWTTVCLVPGCGSSLYGDENYFLLCSYFASNYATFMQSKKWIEMNSINSTHFLAKAVCHKKPGFLSLGWSQQIRISFSNIIWRNIWRLWENANFIF